MSFVTDFTGPAHGYPFWAGESGASFAHPDSILPTSARSHGRILFNEGSNRNGVDEQELTVFIIRKLKQAIKCSRGIYNPELNRMLPPKTLDPEVLTRMAIARVIFTYRGWLFFNPEFMHWTEEKILSYLKHQDRPPGFDESCSCGK